MRRHYGSRQNHVKTYRRGPNDFLSIDIHRPNRITPRAFLALLLISLVAAILLAN